MGKTLLKNVHKTRGNTMIAIEQYLHDRDEQVRANLADRDLRMATHKYTEHLVRTNYTKNLTWMGVPVIQYPGDLMVMQELVWKIKPDVIIETGIAFGGMTLFYRNLVEFGDVISIDIDIRPHAREVLKNDGIDHLLIQGSSISKSTLKAVKDRIKEWGNPTIFVSLDSNHTHDHVLQELQLYSPLVSVGSYIVVFDTAIEQFGHLDKNQDRPWGKGNNPATAVKEFMENNKEFVVDREVEQRAGITAAIGGWLRRVR